MKKYIIIFLIFTCFSGINAQIIKDFGKVFEVESPDLLLAKDKEYKVIFDIYTDYSNGEKLNPLIKTKKKKEIIIILDILLFIILCSNSYEGTYLLMMKLKFTVLRSQLHMRSSLHPVRIARIRCPRFVPRVGLPRNLFLIGSLTTALRFSKGWVRKDANLGLRTGCIVDFYSEFRDVVFEDVWSLIIIVVTTLLSLVISQLLYDNVY